MPHSKKYEIMDKAHQAIYRAIKKGILTRKPCRDCGEKKVHGHHPNYKKPLEVIWLCKDCHGAEHKKLHAKKKK